MIEQIFTSASPTPLQEPASWRDLLATLISDPKLLAHAVETTDITAVTLKRWSGKMKLTTTPRSYMLKPLLVAFPDYAELFIRLIVKEFPDFAPSDKPEFLLNDGTEVALE